VAEWVRACGVDDVEDEDLIRFDHAGHMYAIYKSPEGAFFATDGMCTHEKTCLADGLVMGDVIECPKHNGRFNYKTGKGLGAPIIEDLRTYPAKVEGDDVLIEIG
jgi:3-phenylpropionate/trans-cinnamate dioxygenase ferredoxin subunit